MRNYQLFRKDVELIFMHNNVKIPKDVVAPPMNTSQDQHPSLTSDQIHQKNVLDQVIAMLNNHLTQGSSLHE